MALLSESNSSKFLPMRCMAMKAGASWAFIDTVWASPTASSDGTKTFVTTVSATQPSTMGTASTRIAWAIFDRSVVTELIVGLSAPHWPTRSRALHDSYNATYM